MFEDRERERERGGRGGFFNLKNVIKMHVLANILQQKVFMSKNYKACLDVKSNAIKHNGFIAIHLKTDRSGRWCEQLSREIFS